MHVFILTKQPLDDQGNYRLEPGEFRGVFCSVEAAQSALREWYSYVPESKDYGKFWVLNYGIWVFPEGRVGRWHIYQRQVEGE